MPHNLRTLAHERTSIFKCKQHTLYDPKGPENNFYCFNSNVIYHICFWSILDFFNKCLNCLSLSFSFITLSFLLSWITFKLFCVFSPLKSLIVLPFGKFFDFWARKNWQMAPHGITLQHLRMQLLQWLDFDNKRKRRYQGANASNILLLCLSSWFTHYLEELF